jgi:hypothetical protein
MIMAPFLNESNKQVVQEFLTAIKDGNVTNVNAMIIISDDMVVSESLFDKPLIISQVTYEESDLLRPYSHG